MLRIARGTESSESTTKKHMHSEHINRMHWQMENMYGSTMYNNM